MNATSIMLLQCSREHFATKRHTLVDGKLRTETYNISTLVYAEEVPASSLNELGAVLDKLADKERLVVIRGQLTRGRLTASGVRRISVSKKDGPPPEFEDADRQWLLCDLDGAPAPSWLDPTDPESLRSAVLWAVEKYLPKEFHGIALYYAWSCSAGVKPWDELRLHLWFWLDRGACDRSLKAWLMPWRRYLDLSIYQASQPHFTARPIFIGATDPLQGQRSGMLEGHSEVILPPQVVDLATWREHERKAEEQRQRARDERAARIKEGTLIVPSDPLAAGALGRESLKRACAAIAAAPEGDRHAQIFKRSAQIGAIIAAGAFEEAEAIAALEAAAFAALPPERHDEAARTIADGIERGAANPINLERWAMSRDDVVDLRRKANFARLLGESS